MTQLFSEFEHESWQRVATKYDEAWSSLTPNFIPALLASVNIRNGVRVLDVACGPGYVAAAAKAGGGEPSFLNLKCTQVYERQHSSLNKVTKRSRASREK